MNPQTKKKYLISPSETGTGKQLSSIEKVEDKCFTREDAGRNFWQFTGQSRQN
jgi:hypothetical protein